MQRWKAAALVSMICSSVLSVWLCREGHLLGHRLGPALAPLRRPPRTLDARIARLAQSTAYEDEVSFMDVHSRYHTVHELSARECACV
ncbi:PREDICTED: neurturin [Dipodomys ordii]|uniref:Neurturin n=1 Tax=Dipodomys ordii TaxID=10020 RepID=A0A1S3FNG9_DIPOR|nr:PREDICTED: neurturin [Dipodomys ordii]